MRRAARGGRRRSNPNPNPNPNPDLVGVGGGAVLRVSTLRVVHRGRLLAGARRSAFLRRRGRGSWRARAWTRLCRQRPTRPLHRRRVVRAARTGQHQLADLLLEERTHLRVRGEPVQAAQVGEVLEHVGARGACSARPKKSAAMAGWRHRTILFESPGRRGAVPDVARIRFGAV